jgi:hypothetical protein
LRCKKKIFFWCSKRQMLPSSVWGTWMLLLRAHQNVLKVKNSGLFQQFFVPTIFKWIETCSYLWSSCLGFRCDY